jgi:hypothetical protein
LVSLNISNCFREFNLSHSDAYGLAIDEARDWSFSRVCLLSLSTLIFFLASSDIVKFACEVFAYSNYMAKVSVWPGAKV